MEVGKGRQDGDGRRFACGNGRMMQCEDDVLLNYALETCMIFANQCHPNEFD